MATKLKGLRIKRVALVDEGANPDAHIRFAKRKDESELQDNTPCDDGMVTSEEAQNLLQRFANFVVKAAFKSREITQPISKDAHTFSEAEAVRNCDEIMDKEVWPAVYAMADSIRSILFDTDKSDLEKETLLKTSASEFATALSSYAGSWASGKLANAAISKSEDTLVKMRDEIDAAIAKARGDEETPPDGQGEGDTNPNNEPAAAPAGDNPESAVTKGAIDMKFNTEAMTPEERTQYEDLAKRYGTEEANEPNTNPDLTPAPAAQPSDDVVKGMRTELDELRKFKADVEERELTEVAKRYTILGKKVEDLLPVMKSLKATSPEAYAQYIAGMDSAVKAVEESGTFAEIGKRGTAGNGDDAWGKIETAATEIQKSKAGMSWADAIDQACMQHPDLLEQYEKSRQ